jgi:uncharacterized protein (UPF0262 family)
VLDIRDAGGNPLEKVALSLAPFRGLVKDYFILCESYYNAVKTTTPTKLESIDMGRRSVHNDGAALLRETLSGQVTVDFATARQLFTLLCVLHIR